MKIIRRTEDPVVDLSVFADQHQLALEITHYEGQGRYTAKFQDVEVKDGSILCCTYGDGASETSAIAAYANAISHRQLVYGAYSRLRREFRAPRLMWKEEAS